MISYFNKHLQKKKQKETRADQSVFVDLNIIQFIFNNLSVRTCAVFNQAKAYSVESLI